MTIKDLEIGQSAVVKTVGGAGSLRQHFLDMGVIPGAEVTLVKYAPMGDPMELRLHGYELTLRIADAEQIEVESAWEPGQEREKGTAVSGKKTAVLTRISTREHPGFGEGGRYHVKEGENPLPKETCLTFALAGNQNCGKTT